MKGKARLTLARVCAVLLTLFCLLTVIYMQGVTLVPWWRPMLVGAAVAIPASLRLGGRFGALVGIRGKWIGIVAGAISIVVVVMALFYSANYFINASGHPEAGQKAAVTRVYRKQQHRTRRVGRRFSARGEPYWVYRMDVRFDDGYVKTLSIQPDVYNRVSRGDSIVVPVRRGCLGLRIINPAEISYDFKCTGHGRNRYFGRSRHR